MINDPKKKKKSNLCQSALPLLYSIALGIIMYIVDLMRCHVYHNIYFSHTLLLFTVNIAVEWRKRRSQLP